MNWPTYIIYGTVQKLDSGLWTTPWTGLRLKQGLEFDRGVKGHIVLGSKV